jgi:tRNA dimethylallyltransferase
VLRNKLPILVGGTGLYVDSLLYDYSFLPVSNPEMRALLNTKDLEYLKSKVLEESLDTDGVDMRNKRRLIRLLENDGLKPEKNELRENTIILGIQIEREELRSRITSRVEGMFEAGLENEVANLQKKYGWDLEPMKGIGYREFFEYFKGAQTLEETKARIISATLNLAKRQRTWFKRNKSIQWIDKEDKAVDLVTTFLSK